MPTNSPDTAIINTDNTPEKYIWRMVSRARSKVCGNSSRILSRNKAFAPSVWIKAKVFAPVDWMMFIAGSDCVETTVSGCL